MRSVFIILITFLVVACSESNEEKEKRKAGASFSKEIGERIKLLNKNNVQTNTLKVNPNEVDSVVNTLIRLSKDIENMKASAIRSNQYFDTLASRYSISPHEFTKIYVGMHVDDVATTLKDNELKFFNLILLKNNKGDLLLKTAQ